MTRWCGRALVHTRVVGGLLVTLIVAAAKGQECTPSLADKCFSLVSNILSCSLQPGTAAQDCKRSSAQELCDAFYDGLNCTSDVIDTECLGLPKQNFDMWLRGLQEVRTKLCKKANIYLTEQLITSPFCWNLKIFLQCMAESSGVTAVHDLVSYNLDVRECNAILSSMSVCSVRAEGRGAHCAKRVAAVTTAFVAFFSATPCGHTALQDVLQSRCSSYTSATAGIAVLLTILASIVALSVGTVLLVKNNIIVINKTLKIPQTRIF